VRGEAKSCRRTILLRQSRVRQALAENLRDARAALDLGIAEEMPARCLRPKRRTVRRWRSTCFAEAQNNLGVLLRERGQLDEAISCSSAAKANPDSAAAHQNLALALEDSKQLEQAASEYKRALELASMTR
jgi:tetratricopeptide (TPR) repeat protein